MITVVVWCCVVGLAVVFCLWYTCRRNTCYVTWSLLKTYLPGLVSHHVDDFVWERRTSTVYTDLMSVTIIPSGSQGRKRVCDLCLSVIPVYDSLVKLSRRYYHLACIESLITEYVTKRVLLLCLVDEALPREVVMLVATRLRASFR